MIFFLVMPIVGALLIASLIENIKWVRGLRATMEMHAKLRLYACLQFWIFHIVLFLWRPEYTNPVFVFGPHISLCLLYAQTIAEVSFSHDILIRDKNMSIKLRDFIKDRSNPRGTLYKFPVFIIVLCINALFWGNMCCYSFTDRTNWTFFFGAFSYCFYLWSKRWNGLFTTDVVAEMLLFERGNPRREEMLKQLNELPLTEAQIKEEKQIQEDKELKEWFNRSRER